MHVKRAKGSERMLYHPDIGGRPESYPLKCHGEGDDVRKRSPRSHPEAIPTAA